ncbi:ubiquitin-2 like Rad60 SUMO-like-domain-containing protein [Lactarius hatsudake]|nr:ubiquitin-2 like Rad60 SUMO-like-domain-containing protein [Lactarius hatsudake]KAH8983039.1 ubiquitin-2 like Rad60 SUMO-like-domain-containing protein [Lactarius hatsudake]
MSQDPTTQGSEVKSEIDNPTINVKVVSSSGEEVFFKIKRSTKLSKLQGAYASKVGKDVSTIRFLYDGARINDEDTPASLDMEDNDTIDVMVERTSPPSFPEPSLILGPIVSRGWRVPAALTPPTLPFLVLPSTHTSVPPAANHLFPPSRILCVDNLKCSCNVSIPVSLAHFFFFRLENSLAQSPRCPWACVDTPEGQRLCSPFRDLHTRSAVGVFSFLGLFFGCAVGV